MISKRKIKLTKERRKLLSVIVPAYRQEKTIAEDLKKIRDVLEQLRYPFEIICVVDGKTDNTFSEVEKVGKSDKRIKVVGYLTNLGKGHAVRFGMAKAEGDIIGFIDAGMDLNPNGISMLLEHFEWYNADIIVGSKRHPVSKGNYPWQRKVLSFGYQVLVRILFGLKIKDTQAGIKFFKREVLVKTMPRLLVKAFAFDVEMIAVAKYLGFTRIYEAPIEMKIEFGGASVLTSKGFINYAINMLKDTLAVFYRLKVLHYYDYNNRKNWITPRYLTLVEKK